MSLERMWLWRTYENSLYPRSEFVELPCRQPTFQHLMVALGWTASPSAAQKSIERGELEWARNYQDAFKKVRKFNEPVHEGWPIEVRWRKRHAEVMRPLAYQGRRCWSHLMPQTLKLTWWHYYSDKLENWWRGLWN